MAAWTCLLHEMLFLFPWKKYLSIHMETKRSKTLTASMNFTAHASKVFQTEWRYTTQIETKYTYIGNTFENYYFSYKCNVNVKVTLKSQWAFDDQLLWQCWNRPLLRPIGSNLPIERLSGTPNKSNSHRNFLFNAFSRAVPLTRCFPLCRDNLPNP